MQITRYNTHKHRFNIYSQSKAHTSGVGGLSEDFNVQGVNNILLHRCPVSIHHTSDGLSQTAEVIKHLKGRAHLRRILMDEAIKN